jgi:hypothetical protein
MQAQLGFRLALFQHNNPGSVSSVAESCVLVPGLDAHRAMDSRLPQTLSLISSEAPENEDSGLSKLDGRTSMESEQRQYALLLVAGCAGSCPANHLHHPTP